jgi:hypothetical protein
MPPVEGTVVDEALEEILTALENTDPLLEGLRDYARLNLKPETMAVINEAIQHHERRVVQLASARDAMTSLLADGFPTLPVHEVTQAVYDDLAENNRTIDAAFAHFTARERASTLGLESGAVESKL